MSDRLREIFREHVRWKGAGSDRSVNLDVLAEARQLYAASPPEEQRQAYWAFGRYGWRLAETTPLAVRCGFLLGDEDEPVFEGYDQGNDWNGWAVPLLGEDAVRKLVELFNAQEDESGDDGTPGMFMSFDGEVLIMGSHEEPEDVSTSEAYLVETADGPQRLWEASLGLTWTKTAPGPVVEVVVRLRLAGSDAAEHAAHLVDELLDDGAFQESVAELANDKDLSVRVVQATTEAT